MKSASHHESLAERERVAVWIFSEADDLRIAELLSQGFAEIDRRQLGRFIRVELLKTAPKVEELAPWPREGHRW